MFLTRPAGTKTGDPAIARPCKCDHPFGDADGCVLCGRLPEATIARTWAIYGPANARKGAARRLELAAA